MSHAFARPRANVRPNMSFDVKKSAFFDGFLTRFFGIF